MTKILKDNKIYTKVLSEKYHDSETRARFIDRGDFTFHFLQEPTLSNGYYTTNIIETTLNVEFWVDISVDLEYNKIEDWDWNTYVFNGDDPTEQAREECQLDFLFNDKILEFIRQYWITKEAV